jgi:hypothetical protein
LGQVIGKRPHPEAAVSRQSTWEKFERNQRTMVSDRSAIQHGMALILGLTQSLYPHRGWTRHPGMLLVSTLYVVLGVHIEAYAVPETWATPIQTITGNASSGFGSAIACSASVSGLNHSYIAIGAPQANSGEGRVYVAGPAGVVKTISPPVAGGTGNFGYALTFVSDINGDGINELVIGEPDADGPNGSVHMYLSRDVAADPYIVCGTRTGSISFGSTIFQTSDFRILPVQIVVARTDDSPALETFVVTESMGLCDFTPETYYTGGSSGDSRYGQSLGEIDTGAYPENDLLVGAPGRGSNAGTVFSKTRVAGMTARYSGVATEQIGVAVASLPISPLFVFNAPYGSSGHTVYVKRQELGSYSDYCSLYIPMSDLSETAGRSLLHLNTVFDDFLSVVGGAAFASYRSEAETGGSVALFGAASSMCTAAKQVNNCIYDPGQKQGQVLAGGEACVTTGGARILVVGAPGFSSNTGRVDIYAEGSEFESAVPCSAPTSTPTPTFTPTATPIPEERPIVEPTVTPGSSTPIPVDPRTIGLPRPEAQVSKSSVSIIAPLLKSRLKQFRFIGYVFVVIQTSAKTSVGALNVEGAPFTALRTASRKKREIFARRNRITLRNLGSGTYTASYRPVFAQGKGRAVKRVFGRLSAKQLFRIS